jgi:hypothetical protein
MHKYISCCGNTMVKWAWHLYVGYDNSNLVRFLLRSGGDLFFCHASKIRRETPPKSIFFCGSMLSWKGSSSDVRVFIVTTQNIFWHPVWILFHQIPCVALLCLAYFTLCFLECVTYVGCFKHPITQGHL